MITIKIMTLVSLCTSFFSLGYVLSTLILWDGGGLDSRIVRRFRRWRRERRRRKEVAEQQMEGITLASAWISVLHDQHEGGSP